MMAQNGQKCNHKRSLVSSWDLKEALDAGMKAISCDGVGLKEILEIISWGSVFNYSVN